MPKQKTKSLSLKHTIMSLVITILLWSAVTNAWGYTKLLGIEDKSFLVHIFNFVARLVWASYAIFLLIRYKDDVPTKFKELYTNVPKLKPFVITVLAVVVYHICSMFFTHGGLWINPKFNFFKHLFIFAMVAFAEELVYRGWGLNALSKFMSAKKANFISCLFFVILHLPAYIIQYFLIGTFLYQTIIVQCFMVFILGLVFGYLYSKGKSLWSCMVVHFLCDFLSVMMIG